MTSLYFSNYLFLPFVMYNFCYTLIYTSLDFKHFTLNVQLWIGSNELMFDIYCRHF